MSVFDKLFGTTPAPAAPAAAANPGNLNPAAAQPIAGNPNVPATLQTPNSTEPAAPASPMDQFSDLWQPSDIDPAANAPLINIDPKQLAEAAKKTDFSKIISPELRARVNAGGEDGTAAMMQAMNQMAQGVYAQAAFASSKIIEQAVAKAREQFNADIPAHIKKLQVSDNLRAENPVFNHPASSPILGAIESQLTVKYPNASAKEITGMATQYLENFANAVRAPADAAAAAAAKKNSGETDWSTFA
jgi:hypothetical protein